MFDWLTPTLDDYDRAARFKPAMFSGLPLVASTVLLIPELGVIWGAIGGLVVYSGGTMLLMQICRDLGKKLEVRLYQRWGGKPSVALLRHSDDRLGTPTKERYRLFLSEAVPGLSLPSPEEERNNPEQADEAYESANDWLLEKTRDDDRFALLFKENMNYGFRRNLVGLKPLALVMDGMALALVIRHAGASWTGHFATTVEALGAAWWASAAITIGHLLVFVVRMRGPWVQVVAEAYARRLLGACNVLDGDASA